MLFTKDKKMITIIANINITGDCLEELVETLVKIKQHLKKDDVAKEICKEHGFDIDIIDGIPMEFVDDLEASAKTIDARIQLSTSLLKEDFEIIMRYAIHELVHSLQHMRSEGINLNEDVDYLDREDELDAFKFQIKYDAKERGIDEAESYVEDLVEYHEVPNEIVEDKKKELLEKI
jgi:hypothetical protein